MIALKNDWLKRNFDILFSLFIIILGLPLFITLALLVKLTSKGSIFFYSERVGRGRKKIYCIKFRTMKEDAKEILQPLLNNNPALKNEWEIYQKLKVDPRITFFGNFLRKSSLDELPQFFNVLKGDLSVVGPRPLTEEELGRFQSLKIDQMLSVRPGITGLSQTSGRNNLSLKERIDLEISYVQNQSFLKDFLLILKTIPLIFFCKGAY